MKMTTFEIAEYLFEPPLRSIQEYSTAHPVFGKVMFISLLGVYTVLSIPISVIASVESLARGIFGLFASFLGRGDFVESASYIQGSYSFFIGLPIMMVFASVIMIARDNFDEAIRPF